MSFWGKVFSESDGTPSFSRVATAVLVGCSIGWISYLVVHNHAMPDMAGIATLIGTLYGINHLPSMISSFRNGNGNGAALDSSLPNPLVPPQQNSLVPPRT